MSTMADDINEQVNAGRKTIAMSTEEADELEPRRVPPAVIAAGVGAAVIGLGLLGWLIYRSRRRRTLLEQLQAALPDRMSELRDLGVDWRDQLRERGVDWRDQLRERVKKAL
ncbi:MAG: hypothetical protein E6I72_06265 [Chloroflexi bacterium]|nr:MAG: hypothetical protein E6I72_06265 [Chloroflexota bacterium]